MCYIKARPEYLQAELKRHDRTMSLEACEILLDVFGMDTKFINVDFLADAFYEYTAEDYHYLVADYGHYLPYDEWLETQELMEDCLGYSADETDYISHLVGELQRHCLVFYVPKNGSYIVERC